MLSLREAARMLGGSVAGPRNVTCPGPGHSPHDRSLSVTFDDRGDFVVFSHAGDDWQACRDFVRDRLGLGRWSPERRPRPIEVKPSRTADETGQRLALRIWNESASIRGTLAEAYLASRGLDVDERAEAALRFNPSLRFGQETVPGMVALFRDLKTDEPCGIHRVFLSREGAKLDRWMLGRIKGAAVKLDPDEEVTLGLVVGEGIESCLAARTLGYRPCWALGSAGAIASMPVLGGIEALTIVGEINDHGANEKAARECGKRWAAAGCEVKWLEPFGGDDANDVLRKVMA